MKGAAIILVLFLLAALAACQTELELYSIKPSPDRVVVQENEEVDFTVYVKNYGQKPEPTAPVYVNVTHANQTTEFNCGYANVPGLSIASVECGTVTATGNDSTILVSAYVDWPDSNSSDNYKNLTLTVHATSNIPEPVPETHWVIAVLAAATAAVLAARRKQVA